MKHLACALIVVGLLAFCGCDQKQAQPPAQHVSLNVLASYIPPELIDNFQEETHIAIKLDTVADAAKKYDVVLLPEQTIESMMKANRLAPLDQSALANFANVLPEFKDQPFDPGNKYSVPLMSGVVGIAYNGEKTKAPINSFKDAFKAEHAGRIVVTNDDARELVACAMLANNLRINDITPENLSKVRPMLAEWVKMIKRLDGKPATKALLDGDADIAIVRNGDAGALIAQDKRFKWTVASEGAHRFIDNLAISADTQHKPQAHAFIDFLLRADSAKAVTDRWPFTNPNVKARELMTPEQLADPVSYPSVKNAQLFRDIGTGAEGEIEKLMAEVR